MLIATSVTNSDLALRLAATSGEGVNRFPQGMAFILSLVVRDDFIDLRPHRRLRSLTSTT